MRPGWKGIARTMIAPCAVAIAALALSVPGVLVAPMIIGAGMVSSRVYYRRLKRRDGAR